MNETVAVDGAGVLRRAAWRIIPLLGLAYLVAFMDRSNISFAAKTMNADLGFSATCRRTFCSNASGRGAGSRGS